MLSTVFLLTFFTVGHSQTYNFPYATPGLPWTVIPESDSLPTFAYDTVQENGIRNFFTDPPVRHLYRVYLHPELTTLDSNGRLYAELAREPGNNNEIAYWLRPNIDSISVSTGRLSINRFGFTSDHPSLQSFASISVQADYVKNADDVYELSSFFGDISRSPGAYIVSNGPQTDNPESLRYGYFIQLVDSVYHPVISSLSEIAKTHPLTCSPNPFKNTLSITIPGNVNGIPGILRIVSTITGAEVYRRSYPSLPSGSGLEVSTEAMHSFPSGFYLTVLETWGNMPKRYVGKVVKQ